MHDTNEVLGDLDMFSDGTADFSLFKGNSPRSPCDYHAVHRGWSLVHNPFKTGSSLGHPLSC